MRFYRDKKLIGRLVFAPASVWACYDRDAKQKNWSFRFFMTRLLTKHARRKLRAVKRKKK
jgi:hypothetical protein